MKCDDCGHRFNQTVITGVWISHNPSKCPECGSRRISPTFSLWDMIESFFD